MPRRAHEFASWSPPPIQPIIKPDLLPAGVWGVIFGEQETYKTWLALELAWAVSQGKPWLAWETEKTPTLFLNTELTEPLFHQRWMHMGATRGGFPPLLSVETSLDIKLNEERGLGFLSQWISETGAKLIIIDNLYRAFKGKLSSELEATRLLDNLTFLRKEYNCTILFMAHSRKKAIDLRSQETVHQGIEDLFGSSFFKNNVSLALEVRKVLLPQDEKGIILIPEKTTFSAAPVPTTTWVFQSNATFRRW